MIDTEFSYTGLPDAANQDGRYPRPQLLRRDWCDLGGEWDFAFGTDTSSRNPDIVDFDRRIVVPYPPESAASGIGDTGYHAVVWYRRTFGDAELSNAGLGRQGSRVVLNFGAVDWRAEIWLNGQFIGAHEGGQTPFSFDVTDALRAGDTNQLVVRAFDDPLDVAVPRGKQDWREKPHAIWYHRTTGIWQPVWLECVPEISIESLGWESDLPGASVDLELSLNARPQADSWAHVTIAFEGEILAESRVRLLDRSSQLKLSIARQRNGQQYEELLWSPSDPRLLSATVVLEGGTQSDAVSSYLGLRSVGISQNALLLNDRPIYMRSVLAQNYWPESCLTAPSADALRREVELIKELGFNAARVHQKAEDPRFLYWADRLGLMIWGEVASSYEFSERAVALLTTEWVDLVRRDRSHPSIVTWVPFNESWGIQHVSHDPRQRAFSRAIADLTRALDGTRPVISNDGWEHTDSDIWTIHDYEGDAIRLADRYATDVSISAMLNDMGPAGRRMISSNSAERRPVMLTEFGGVSFVESEIEGAWGYSSVESGEQFERQVGALFQAARSSTVLAGFCYTQLTDTGQETNGLLRADRTPKVSVESIRRMVEGS